MFHDTEPDQSGPQSPERELGEIGGYSEGLGTVRRRA
jgi:hypothetical protein